MPDLDRNLQPIIKETPQEGNFMGPFPPSLGVGGGLYQYPDAAKADISATDRLADISRRSSPDLREIYITNQTLAENQRYKSFNPTTEDYEDFAAYGQSWGDKAANGILKGLNLAATTVAGGFGMLGGIGLWATGGKFSDIWDNQFLRKIDEWNQKVDNKYLPNYYTRAERDASVWSPTNWFKANFLFDKLIKNAGFAVGAMIGGNIANAGLLRLGAVLGEGAAYLSTATTAFKPFSQLMRATARAFSAGKNIEAAAILEKEISSIADITRNASAIKKIAQQTNNYFRFSDGARRIGVAAYSSAGEAAFEAIQTVNEYKDTLIKKYIEENGEEPTGKALQEIQKEVDVVGARSFLGNLAILGATEWAQLPYLMGSTFKGSRHTANSVMGKVDDVIMENGKWVTKQRIPTKFGKILDKARGVGIYLFDPKETVQEMGQYALQVGVQNYFDKAKLTNAADFWVDGITYGLFGRDEFGEGKGAFVSKEGVESGILGALTGGLMQARGHYLEQRAITKNNSVFAEELNNAPTFKEAFKERLAAINRGVILQQQEQDAVLNGDELEAKDLKTDAFINYLMPRIKFGRFDMVMDDLETLKLITATEEGLAEIRAQGMANLSDSISEYHERLDKLGRFANTINDLYSSLNLRYAGETLKDKDGEEVLVEGKPVRKYSDRAIDKLVYAATKVADYDYRIPSLTGRLLSKGIDVSEILTEIINEDTPNIEATKVALEKINQLSSPEDKVSLKRDLIDVMELSLRRNFYLQEYEAIKTHPDIYDKFDVAYSRETEPVEVSQGRGKAKKTLDVKKPYFIDEVLYKDGTTLTLGPQIEVMDETLGGEFQVKLPNGKVAFLTPEEFRSFKLVDTPVAPAGVERILDEVIEEVMNRPKYKGIPKSPKENKLEYINSLGNQKLVNDIKKTFNDRAEKFIREEREKQAKREALIKEQENIKKQQAEIELKSGEETVPTDITGEEREIEGAKKPTETYFKSTISQSEGSEDENWQDYLTAEVPPHIMRARVFLNDAKFLKDKKGNPLRSRLKAIFVTPNNVEGLGLKGLIQLSYRKSDDIKVEEIENALDVEKGFMAAVFVEQDGDRLYFVNEKGERIGKIGTKVDINKVVFQTMPTTSTLTSKNTPRARKGEEELFIEYAKAWKKVREKEFNTPAREVVAHPFGISRGIPIIEYEDATRKTSKKHHVSSSLVSEEIISSQEDLLRISTTGEIFNDPVEGEGRGIRFKKGFTVLKYFDTVEAVYNNKLGEKRAKSVYMVIKALAQELQEKKTINAAYAEFLQTVLYWKKSATTKNNQIYIDENTAEIHIAGKAFSITDIVNKEAEIVNILKDVHHHINNKTLKDNFHSKYYEYVDDMDNPVEWINYQTYLLSSKDAGGKPREVASTPLVTQVKPPTAATPYSFAQKYAVIGEVDLPIVAPKAEPKTRPVPKQPSKKTETKDKMTYPKGDIFYTSTPNKEGSIDITVEDQETIRLYARDENFIESVLKSLRTIKEYEEQLDNIEQRRDSSVGESLEAVNAEIAILFFANRIKADIVKNQPQQTEETTEEETEEAEVEETVEEAPPVVEEEEIQNQEPPDEIDPKKIKPREDDIDASVVGAEERGRVYEALTEEDISRFKEWAAKTIPNFPIQILENLIQIAPNRMAWGVFENNVIKFYKHAKKGTEFHEAFEAVWGTFLTVDERAAILDEERFSGKEFKEVASGKMIEASEATDKQLKEKIADDFAAFMKGKLPARTLSEKIRQFFKNLIDFIKAFIHKPSRKTELFEAINKGKFSKLPLSSKNQISDISSIGRLTGDLIESEKGQIGVNKQQLLMLLGPTMYNKPLAQVAIKELLQNSFDAVKTRINITNNKSVGNIDIIINYDDRTIAIKDDGIGMTPDIVKNAFLSIGGTNKEGLDVSERSGGFGLAKVQFLLGSEYVKVITIRDGIKTSLEASAVQLYNDDFIINKEKTNEPNGSYVEVKIPDSYTTPEGLIRQISFPGVYSKNEERYKLFDILNKPLIGNTNISFTSIQYDKAVKSIIPIGKNTTEETLPPLFSKIDFSWGSADLYMSVEKKSSPQHRILSSGIYQFDHRFTFKDWEHIPYDIVVNIKPSVSSTSEQYPFNNQREGFKNTVTEDIKSLNAYLKKYASGEAEKEAKAVFSNIAGLPKVDPNQVLTPEERDKLYSIVHKTIEENEKRRIQENKESVEEEVRRIFKLVIDKEGVRNKETNELEISKEKEYKSSFKAEKEISAIESIDVGNFNPSQPQYHNNTSFDYLKIPGAVEFFSDFGSVVLDMVRFAGNELGYDYKKLQSKDEKFFAGVSIDKSYGGVHVRKIINAIFINPLAFDVHSLEEAVGVALHIIIHEINHTTVSGEGASFTSSLAKLYGKIYATGKYGLYEGLFRSVYKKHFETFKILKNEYDKSNTRNLSESFSGDEIQRSSSRDVQRDVEDVSTGQPSPEGYRGDQADNTKDRTGDVILSKFANTKESQYSETPRLSERYANMITQDMFVLASGIIFGEQKESLYNLVGITSESIFNRIKAVYVKSGLYDQLGEDRWVLLVQRTKDMLRSLGINFNEEDLLSINDEETTNRNYAPEPFTTDIKKGSSIAIKALLYTLPQTVGAWKKGSLPKRKVSELQGYLTVDFSKAFATLLRRFSNITDIKEFEDTFVELINEDGDYVRLFTRLGGVLETDDAHPAPYFDFESFREIDWRLFIDFFQTFTKQRPEFIIQYTTGLESFTHPAEFASAIELFKRNWIEALKRMAEEKNSAIKYNKSTKTYSFIKPDWYPKAVPTTIDGKLDFLRMIGIDITREQFSKFKSTSKEGQKSEQAKFSDAVTSLYEYLQNVKDIATISNRTIQVGGAINNIAEILIRATNPNEEIVRINIEGNKTQNYDENNPISLFRNVFNKVKSLLELKEERPELNDVFSTNSVKLQAGGRFFNTDGKRIGKHPLRLVIVDAKYDRGARKGSTIAKMGFGDRLATEINQNLQGIYYTLIPADSSREWALNLGNEIDYTDIVAGKRGINKITKIFRGYLEDDIRLALDYKNRSKLAAISEGKGKRLRFFEDILSYREENGNVVKTKLLLSIEKMINENKPFEDIMEMINQEDNLRQVNESIIEYITEDAQGLLASLRQLNKIVIHSEKGKRNQAKEQTEVLYEFKELLDSFVEDNKLSKTKLTMEQLENIGLFLSANYIINNIEYHKMFFGDPFQFQEKKGKLDEIKRIKSFLSPRRLTFDHPIFRNFANAFYNKVDDIVLKEKEIGRHTFKPYLRTITVKDIPMASQIYGRVDKETDGFSVLMDNGYREVRIRNRQWTERAEQWHQWQLAYTRQHVPNYKYKTKGLEEHDKELLKKPEPEFTIEVLKPIVAGNKANSTHINLVLDKFSQMPLYYKAVEGTELGNLYLKLFEAEVDYVIFENGRKVGSEETYDLYKDGKLNSDAPINFIDVPWNAYGIQVETMHENEFFQTRGSQLTKMASQDLFDGGEPIGDTPERKAAVQKAYDDNIKALNLYHEHAYKHLLDKLGIEDMGTHYRLVSPASVERLLSDEMFRRLLPENAKATIRRNANGDFRIPFESSPYYQQIRDIIFASLNKALVSPVMTGNPSVQVPVSLWETSGKGRGMMKLVNNVWTKITPEEYNTLSEEEKKTVALTSDTLKFYTKEDPYCEIMIPHWFKDLFQGKSDKEILKYLNSTPEGKKILRGIGFRIPTQSLASVETFRVKGFLPAFMGNTVVVPSEIVAKTGSDFDIDKLNLYLKSIHLDANGKVRLTRFLGTEERTVKYFEDLYNQIIYEKITKIEKFNDFRKNLLSFFEKGKEIQLAQLNKESEVPEFTEEEIEFLEKYRPLLQNIIDEAWADGQRHPSEYIKDQIEKLQDAAEEQRLKLFNELMREKFVQRHFRRALENNYYETLEKLLTLPESFERRMQPVDNAGLDKLAEEVQSLRNEGEFSIRNRILNRMFMTKQRHAFLSGKKWVGIAATNITGHITFQKGKVYIDVDKITELSKFERGFIRDGKITLPHNTLLIDGKEVVSLSGRLTADGTNQFISDRLSGYTTAFVDVAHDPYILNLIYSDNVVGTTLFLERIGAGETGLLFMNQPIIIEYLKMLEQQGARGLFGKNNLKTIRNRFGGNTVKTAKSFSIESFKDNIKTYHSGKPLSKQQLAEQLAIFDEFLKYSKMGEHLFRLSQAMNFDTTKFRSADNFYRKRTKTDIAKSGNIFSGVEDVLNNTHIGFQAEMLSKAMASLQAIFKMEHPEIRSILNEMLLPYINELYLSNDKFEKVANRLRTSLLDYIILTKSNLYKEIEDLLVNPKTSVANRLIAAKKKYPQFEILYHLFTETGKRGDETTNTKTLKLDVFPDNPMEHNLYVGAMRELKQYLPNLYNDIVKLAILQGGSRSPVSIKTIIPVEDYAAIITPLLEQVKHRKDIEGFLEGWFQRNNFRDPDIAPDPDLYFDLVRDGSGFSIDTGPIEKGYEILSYISKAYERANPLLKKLGRKSSSREILLLSEEYHEKVVKYDVVVVPRVVRSKRTGELVSIVTGQTVTPPMMAEAFNKGDYTYYDVVGYKRVVDPVSKTPIITPEGEYIYRMINLYGDGHLASEYYPNFQKSVLENGTRKVEKELTDAEIIKALGSEVDISPDNTQEAEVVEAPEIKALPAKTVPEKEGNVLWSTVKNIYEQLPQSTKDPESNVIIEDNFKEAQQKHREGKGIYSLRANFNINSPIVNLTTKHHFGNPYSSNPDALQKDKSLIRTKSTRDSVEKYINWVLNHSNERAQWIREQLKSGKLKGKVIYYYKELGEPSHAMALDYLINKYDWGTTPTEETVPIEPIPEDTSGPSAFTNHSGGAIGSDSLWDEIGRIFGFKNHKHYHAKGEKTPKGNVAISIEELKQADEHLKKANETLGRKFPSTKSFVNNLLRRNYWQVKNAEAIYAIGNLAENEIGEDIVEGGTGWAVQMAIDLGKPVYLFDITDESWYSNIPGEGWQNMEEAPILTKNYAGIGLRLKNTPAEKIEIVKKAITEVYSKTVATFEQVEEQQPILPSEAPVIAPKIEAYYNSLSQEEQEKLGTLEDVLYLYMEIPFLYDEDQFIDELKCKK